MRKAIKQVITTIFVSGFIGGIVKEAAKEADKTAINAGDNVVLTVDSLGCADIDSLDKSYDKDLFTWFSFKCSVIRKDTKAVAIDKDGSRFAVRLSDGRTYWIRGTQPSEHYTSVINVLHKEPRPPERVKG
jgi:hypothetical protein